MATAKDLGKIFKNAREGKGISVSQANQESRIHPNVIQDIENGNIERLGKIYIKSFIKKYSDFLGLDTADMMAQYEAVFDPPVPEPEKDNTLKPVLEKTTQQKAIQHAKIDEPSAASFSAPVDVKKIFSRPAAKQPVFSGPVPAEGKRFSLPDLGDKKMLHYMGAFLIIALIIFVAIFALFTRYKRSLRKLREADIITADERPERTISIEKKKPVAEKTTVAVRKSVPKAEKKQEPAPESKKRKFAIPESAPLILTLKATGEVWLQVFEKNKTVYVGTLNAGEEKTLESKDPLTVWTGKGENLQFVINGRDMGKAVDGVVRNIEVSKKGIRVGDKWIDRIDLQ